MMITCHDVVPDDLNMSISVRPGVLVPEANNVTQFVHNNAKLIAVLANGDCLRAVATFTNKGTASKKKIH